MKILLQTCTFGPRKLRASPEYHPSTVLAPESITPSVGPGNRAASLWISSGSMKLVASRPPVVDNYMLVVHKKQGKLCKKLFLFFVNKNPPILWEDFCEVIRKRKLLDFFALGFNNHLFRGELGVAQGATQAPNEPKIADTVVDQGNADEDHQSGKRTKGICQDQKAQT